MIMDELHRKFGEKFPQRITELEVFLLNALSFIKLVPTPEESVEAESQLDIVAQMGGKTDRPLFYADYSGSTA